MPPNVFISYSHDSEEHNIRVRAFADRLIRDGINCTIDQYETNPTAGWPQWMDQQLDDADFVLVVCTEGYYTKAKAGKGAGFGRGVKFESVLVIQDLYDARMVNETFIPTLFEDLPTNLILRPLRGYTRYRVDRESGYEELFRHLTRQPRLIRPEVGPLAVLPPESAPGAQATVHSVVGVRESERAKKHPDFELYDRRLAAYKKVLAYLHRVTFAHAVDLVALRQFGEDMQEARFLFDEKLYLYLDTIFRNALELHALRARRNTAYRFTNQELQSLAKDDERLFRYLDAQIGEAAQIFKPYLSIFDR